MIQVLPLPRPRRRRAAVGSRRLQAEVGPDRRGAPPARLPPLAGGAAPPYQPPGYPAPGYPAAGYPAAGYPGVATQEPLATWSLVLGILSFVFCPVVGAIAAIITGGRAKKAVDRSGGAKSGRGLATAGQIIGSANLVLSVIAAVLIGLLVNFASHHQTYTSLNAGDCFNPVGHGLFSTLVTKESCDSPHLDEAVGSFELTGSTWPGEDGIRSLADDRCTALARQYVGRTSEQLRLLWFYPNKGSFNNGVRTVLCAVGPADGSKQTGSVAAGSAP